MNACTATRSIRAGSSSSTNPSSRMLLHSLNPARRGAARAPVPSKSCDGSGSCSPSRSRSPRSTSFVKAKRADRSRGPTTSARSAGSRSRWRCSRVMFVIAQIPSRFVAPAAGVLAAGILGNSLSAAWNDMEVPNPLVIGGEHALRRVQPRRRLGAHRHPPARLRDRRLADPEPRPAAPDARGPRRARSRAFRRLFDERRAARHLGPDKTSTIAAEVGYHDCMSLSTEPLFVPCARIARRSRAARRPAHAGRARGRRAARSPTARTSGSRSSTRTRERGATSSSTRTTAWTPGSSPGCRARAPGSTTTTSRASGSASPAGACARI